jgi:sialidase-1
VKIRIILILGLLAAALNAQPLFEHISVFNAGDNNVNTYRIPGVVVTDKGTILAFCEARKDCESDGSPTDIVLKRSFDDGKTFQPMQTLAVGVIHYLRLPEPDVKVEALMDPTPLIDHSNSTIWLSYTQYMNRKMTRNFLIKSTDDGATWSKPIDIGETFGAGFAAGPGRGIQLEYNKEHKGRLIFCGRGHDSQQTVGPFVIYSDDHGQTWLKGKAVPEKDIGGECQIIELTDGSLAINIRSGRQKARVIAISKDAGLTWDKPFDEPQLPEYGCQASVLRYTDEFKNDKNRILFSNPNTTERDRINMTIRLSYDEGKTWPVSKSIHPGPAAYSNLAIAKDGTILCFYEGGEKHRREWIRLTRFNLEWLTDGKDKLVP